MNAAFLFPGQGAQQPGMLHALPNHPAARATLSETSDVLGFDVTGLDSESALQSTLAAQLSLLAAGVAVARALIEEGVRPSAVAGLSVGAFAAAAISGAVSYADCVRLVHRRAQLMESAFSLGYGMAAIVGLSERQVAEVVASVHSEAAPVFSANVNAPRQIVIAGADSAITQVLEQARQQGARKAERLAVATLSHCPLLQPVADALQQMAVGMHLAEPAIPYIGNLRARVLRRGEEVAQDMIGNIAHGVRWYDSMVVLTELRCDLFVAMPPGRILCDLASECFPGLRSLDMESYPLDYPRRWMEKVG